MLINKKISEFLVFETETILHALQKINDNKRRILFVVSDNGMLLGSFADGDFRRWITRSTKINLGAEISCVMNQDVRFASITAERADIRALFDKSIDVVALVDESKRLVAVAFEREKGFAIGKHLLSEETPCYVIAEIGNNHQGDIKLAMKLVDLAVGSGADCVKFQMRQMKALYKSGNKSDASADLGAQYTMDLLSKFQLSNDELIQVFDYVKEKGLSPLCTPWDIPSLEILEEYGMEAYKVASADFSNSELLTALSRMGKPLICSTGMSTENEIRRTTDLLKSKGVEFVLLHCNSTYPTPFKDVNLAYLKRLKDMSGALVGYSGHERGLSVPVAAVSLGAKVIEKHFTIDKSLEGNDHKVSLLPEEFREMVKQIREVEEALGSDGERMITQGEMINREVLAKSIIASVIIKKGDMITRDKLDVKSPGQGLQPIYLDELIGKIVKRDVEAGGFFYPSDLKEQSIVARDYIFNRPFGIPVRYHDFRKLKSKSNLDFVEFHLSYQDMELKLIDFFDGVEDIGFAVHSPELFSGDHILDLASIDDAYRERSIHELNRVCDITRQLKKFFSRTEKPVIVVNVGGFSANGFIAEESRAPLYNLVADSLRNVNIEGIEISIQTMPPFPWHFGGQRYHNLFVNADEIVDFCEKYGYMICFDVSHTMMACNYYKWDLSEFTKKIGTFVAHMHIVDAKGIDGEGIAIGEGDVDFRILSKDLDTVAPKAQFIPEVWQGHKNDGEGFWRALQFLEGYL